MADRAAADRGCADTPRPWRGRAPRRGCAGPRRPGRNGRVARGAQCGGHDRPAGSGGRARAVGLPPGGRQRGEPRLGARADRRDRPGGLPDVAAGRARRRSAGRPPGGCRARSPWRCGRPLSRPSRRDRRRNSAARAHNAPRRRGSRAVRPGRNRGRTRHRDARRRKRPADVPPTSLPTSLPTSPPPPATADFLAGERPDVRWAWTDLPGPGRALLAVGEPGAVIAVLDAAAT